MSNDISQSQNSDITVSYQVCNLILELRNLEYEVFKFIYMCVYVYGIEVFKKIIGQAKEVYRERSGNKRGQWSIYVMQQKQDKNVKVTLIIHDLIKMTISLFFCVLPQYLSYLMSRFRVILFK